MQIKCEYCGEYIDETMLECPNCGGVNNKLKRVSKSVPTTIEELKDFCKKHNLPLDKMRFFIGEDYKGARAFGIYKDENSGNFIVYKNKSNGQRTIRYEGKDETYAVNEIYLKLKDEINNQKLKQAQKKVQYSNNPIITNTMQNSMNPMRTTQIQNNRLSPSISILLKTLFLDILLITLIPLFIAIFVFSSAKELPNTGYYNYNGNYYYHAYDNWYIYNDEISTWEETNTIDELNDNYRNYYSSYSYQEDYNIEDFSNSSYYSSYENSSSYSDDNYSYDDYSSWDSDWDSSYDWDSSSDWDSSYSDWDSDW